MTSSSEPSRVLKGTATLEPLATPELRNGTWTRFGDDRVLGDVVTEQALAGLAATARAAASAQGYSTGWAEGRQAAAAQAAAEATEAMHRIEAAEAQRAAEHAAAVSALMAAVDQFRRLADETVAAVEANALALARELTTEILGHELRLSPTPEADVVGRALALLPEDTTPATVRLHPAVLDSAAAQTLTAAGVRLAADPSLALHDAVVTTEVSVIDASIGAALARVREVLA